MRRLTIVISLIMMLLPAMAWSMGDTTNTDFESGFQANGDNVGVANGWYGYQLWATAAVPSGDTTVFHGASGASQKVEASAGDSQGGVKAKFGGLTPGHFYTVKVWANVVGYGGYASLAVSGTAEENPVAMNYEGGPLWGTNPANCSYGTGGAWAQLTYTVTAQGPAITVFLDSYASVVNWDDLTIEDGGVDPDYVILTGAKPLKIWNEVVRYQGADSRDWAGDPMAHGQVLIDGNKQIIAEGMAGLLLYGDEQVNGTAYVKSTPFWVYGFWPPDPDNGFPQGHGPAPFWPENSNYTSKGGTILNGRLYSVDMQNDIHQMSTWEGPALPYAGVDGPWGLPMATGRTVPADNMDTNGLVTDGTYLYGSDTNTDTANRAGPCTIYKWSVDPAGNGGNGTLTEVWKVTVPSATWLSSIGYYNGKLYAAEAFTGRNIWEIDCSDGAHRTILSGNNRIPTFCAGSWYMGQVARLGNRLVLADWTGHLTQWVLNAGTWTIESSWSGLNAPGYPEAFFGISLKAGPDGNAKYAWASGWNNVYFFDLTPYSSKTDLADPTNWKNGYPAYVGEAVVTAVATDGFWVENKKRTMGAHVLYTPTEAAPMPAKDALVSIKAVGGKSASGERTLTASEVVVDGTFADLKPLFMTNKTLGPATGGAGLATDGMLVKVSGKLSAFDASLFSFYLNDGSGVGNDTPNDVIAGAIKGLKVTKIDGSSFWGVTGITDYTNGTPSIATVVGIVRLQQLTDGTIIRRIDVVNDSDVTVSPL